MFIFIYINNTENHYIHTHTSISNLSLQSSISFSSWISLSLFIYLFDQFPYTHLTWTSASLAGMLPLEDGTMWISSSSYPECNTLSQVSLMPSPPAQCLTSIPPSQADAHLTILVASAYSTSYYLMTLLLSCSGKEGKRKRKKKSHL
jgi:hypothetical protein